jgi:hypothetical protein
MNTQSGLIPSNNTVAMAKAFDLAWSELQAVQPMYTSPSEAEVTAQGWPLLL